MAPDVSREQNRGIIALVVAVILAGGGAWWMLDTQSEQNKKLIQARKSAAAVVGPKPLAELVEAVRAGNLRLRSNIATLKAGMEMVLEEGSANGPVATAGFTVPKAYPDRPSEFYHRRFLAVRQDFIARNDGGPWPIDFDPDLGFGALANGYPPDKDAPALLGRLQLTNKVLGIMTGPDRVDRITRFDIETKSPVLAGPANRPPLLREYPVSLMADGGLPTIMQMLYAFSDRSPGQYPLILRGLTISCNPKNRKPARDNVQQVHAQFDLAAMEFIRDSEREPGGAGGKARSGHGSSTSGARP
ncbi:MAG: hypothetical protein AAB263_11030 [Planctomycetota bacterium]